MRVLRTFFSRLQNWAGILLVGFFIAIAAAAPLLSPMDPENPGPIKLVGRITDHQPRPPSIAAPLGTLSGQISIYHTLIWGSRSALAFGLIVALSTAIIGVSIGTISAYYGGILDTVLMRITDAFLSFPVIAAVVVFQQIMTIILTNIGAYQFPTGFGSTTLYISPYANNQGEIPAWLELVNAINPVMIAFILFSWMPYSRITNVVVKRHKQEEYVQAAKALGSGHTGIIFRHLIPNSISPILVLVARDIGAMVLFQATFTYIGLGGDSLWGMLLVNGRNWILAPGGILTYWWVFLPATLALILFGIGWNLVGDSLNDVLNPRLR